MLYDILSMRAIRVGIAFFFLVVGGSLLYSWYVHHTTNAELAETQQLLKHREDQNAARTAPIDFTPPGDPIATSEETRASQTMAEATAIEATENEIDFGDADIEMILDEIGGAEPEIIEESSEYPEVPPGFPFRVIWEVPEEQRAEIPPGLFEELEVLGLVMIQLWKEGDHDFTGAFMANGRVFPTYPDVAYVKWEEAEEPGEWRITEVSTVDSSISDQLLNGVIPPGIEIVDQDTSGIDPSEFLVL